MFSKETSAHMALLLGVWGGNIWGVGWGSGGILQKRKIHGHGQHCDDCQGQMEAGKRGLVVMDGDLI